MEDPFVWDPEKARANYDKHGVSFSEASSIFGDPLMMAVEDGEHSFGEQRYQAIGLSIRSRLLFVVFSERDRGIRIISAREATRRERKSYEG